MSNKYFELQIDISGNPGEIVITNAKGDTYTSKSESLIDFFHDVKPLLPTESDEKEAEKYAKEASGIAARPSVVEYAKQDFLAGKLHERASGKRWVKVEEKEPTETDGQIIATNGNGFYEIIWKEDAQGFYRKPFPFDKYDRPAFYEGGFTHWMPLPSPPKP
jgi:hypothetical protein